MWEMSTNKPRLLIVDDSGLNRTMLTEIFKDEYVTLCAKSGEEALSIVPVFRPDIILLDVIMNGLSGFDVCRRLKDDTSTRGIPVVFVTSSEDKEAEIQGLSLGALDFILKPYNPVIIKQRIKNYITLQRALAELEQLAITDQLTGLYNRRYFFNMFQNELCRNQRYRHPLSLLLLDIDHFKTYNDRRGHLAGDQCLRRIADTLRGSLRRSTDFVARYGGEEFVVLLPETDEAGAQHTAEYLRAAVEKLGMRYHDSDESVVTVSIGVACCAPGLCISDQLLLDQADTAMYAAKSSGRNRVALSERSEIAAFAEAEAPLALFAMDQ